MNHPNEPSSSSSSTQHFISIPKNINALNSLRNPQPNLSSESFSPPQLSVLIVDDNELNLRVMRQILSKKLAQFVHLPSLRTASSGPQALALLSQQIFHLLLLDISMPGMSGLEVARRLRGTCGPGDLALLQQAHSLILPSNRHLDICAVTTDLADWQVDMYRRAGMNGVIGKPLKEDDIRHALLLSIRSSFNFGPPNLLQHSLSTPRFPPPSIDPLPNTSTSSHLPPKSRKRSLSAKTIYAGRARYPFFFRLHGSPHPLPHVSPAPLLTSLKPTPPLILHSELSDSTIQTIRPRFNRLQTSSSVSSPPFPVSASTGPTRDWTCTSVSSTETPWRELDKLGSEETDPFAAGFGALLDADDSSDDDANDDQWANLRSRSQLLTRRSIPLFWSRDGPPPHHRRHVDEDDQDKPHRDDDDDGHHHTRHGHRHLQRKRQTRSDCGSPARFTFSLPWLGKKDQSVLREGPLLQEMLGVMDIEDVN